MTTSVISGNGQVGADHVVTPIGSVRWRQQAHVKGRIRSMRVQPWANVASLECVIVDETGGLVIVFLGRRQVPGVELGRELTAAGIVGETRGYLAMLNPQVELLAHEAPLVFEVEKKRPWWRRR